MNRTAMIIAALVAIPAVGLATWAWFAIAEVEEELSSFSGFEGMHCDIDPQAAATSAGAT